MLVDFECWWVSWTHNQNIWASMFWYESILMMIVVVLILICNAVVVIYISFSIFYKLVYIWSLCYESSMTQCVIANS